MEWDENSRFFHVAASGRRRKNKIHCLEHEGVELHSHDANSMILYDFYRSLLGSPVETDWKFNLSDLYPSLSVAHLPLSDPFTADEISEALFAMDMNASPGPDGFEPAFYKFFWANLKPYVLQLFRDFHSGSIDLDGLNRAHLILLPKHDGVQSSDGYCPISLQNCLTKFSKVMANRLKAVIPVIVDADQTVLCTGDILPRILSMSQTCCAAATNGEPPHERIL
jgi:hypothetical protein